MIEIHKMITVFIRCVIVVVNVVVICLVWRHSLDFY